MSDEFVFCADEATVSNLERLCSEWSLVNEQRTLELSELADSALDLTSELLYEECSVYEILSIIGDGLDLGKHNISNIALPENRDVLSVYASSLTDRDRAEFCMLYARGAAEKGMPITERSFLPTDEGEATFTYVRNSFADEAYDVFSQDFPSSRVRYATSFNECVAAVLSGESRFCLLPLEERGSMRLSSVSELIFRHDLRISAVTPVFGYDGLADMKYACVSRGYSVPQSKEGDDRYIEIRLGTESDGALSGLMTAVRLFGMSVYRVNTMTFDTEGEARTYFSLVLRDGGRDFTALLTYLILFVPDHVVVGVYKNLE